MKPQMIIKEALNTIGWTQKLLGDKMGYTSPGTLANKMNGKTMNVDTFVKMMDLMGYEVIVKSKSRDNKNTWVVTNEEKDS